MNVLRYFMNSQHQEKTMSEDKAALLWKYDSELFGKQIETKEILTDSKKSPFHGAPHNLQERVSSK